jgi:phenylalanyl-tRNA synthetase beta chain
MRAVVENIFRRLGVSMAALKYTQCSDEIYSVALNIDTRSGRSVARIGLIRHQLLKRFDIERDVVYAQIDWSALFKAATDGTVTFREIPRTQPVDRDLALLVDKNMKFADIEAAIRGAERKLLRDVRLFDVYEGKNLPEGKKSYAVALQIQDDEKTLADKQIEAIMNKIIKALQNIGAELR